MILTDFFKRMVFPFGNHSLVFFALLTMGISLGMGSEAKAGNISKRYVTHATPAGKLYHIRQQKMSPADVRAGKKPLLYDLTHMLGTDSVLVTVTMFTTDARRVSAVHVQNIGTQSFERSIETLYVEKKRQLFKHRLRFVISPYEARALWSGRQPFVLDFGGGARFSFSQKQWRRQSETVTQIFQLMELNR